MALFYLGCGLSEEEMKEMAIAEYNRKVSVLRKQRMELCRKDAIAEAERQADSIIFEFRINPLSSEVYKPEAPPKPTFIPTDSLSINSKNPVKPIIDSLN